MTTVDFEKLQQVAEKQIQFDKDNLQGKLTDLPRLYQGYLRILIKEQKELSALKNKLDERFGQLYQLYKFESTYRWESKNEIESQINSDQSYIQLKIKYQEQDSVVNYLSITLDNIKSMSFQIRSYIDYEKFLNGE